MPTSPCLALPSHLNDVAAKARRVAHGANGTMRPRWHGSRDILGVPRWVNTSREPMEPLQGLPRVDHPALLGTGEEMRETPPLWQRETPSRRGRSWRGDEIRKGVVWCEASAHHAGCIRQARDAKGWVAVGRLVVRRVFVNPSLWLVGLASIDPCRHMISRRANGRERTATIHVAWLPRAAGGVVGASCG